MKFTAPFKEILLVKIMLCGKLHCQKSFELKRISGKIKLKRCKKHREIPQTDGRSDSVYNRITIFRTAVFSLAWS